MATPQNFKEVGKRLKKSVDSIGGLAEAIAYANANGTAENPVEIPLAVPLTIPNTANFTLDKTGYLEQYHGAYLDFNNQNGKLNLIGRGVKDPTSDKPIFMNAPVNAFEDANAAAGGVNSKGVKWGNSSDTAPVPKAISTELFGFTVSADNESFDKKVNRATRAFKGLPVTVICHSGRKTKSFMVTEPNHSFHLLKGDYVNEITSQAISYDMTNFIEYVAPFLISENTYFTGEDGAKWYQGTVSTAENSLGFAYPRWYRDDDNAVQGIYSAKNIEIHGAGALSHSGTRGIFVSGAMRMLLDKISFYGATSYPILIMSLTEELNSDGSEITNCYAEDTWTYIFNTLRGINARWSNNHAVLKNVPTDWVFGGSPYTGFIVYYADIEPNIQSDDVYNVTYENGSIRFPDTVPVGYSFDGGGFVIQSPWKSVKSMTIDGFRQTGTPQAGFGSHRAILAYGVDGLTVRGLEVEDTFNFAKPFDISRSRNVSIELPKLTRTHSVGKFAGCPGLTWISRSIKDFKTTLFSTPTIEETEVFTPVHISGTNVYSDRPFNALGYNRFQDWYPDAALKFNLQNTTVVAQSISDTVINGVVSWMRRMTVDEDFGLGTAKTFTNANISGKRITINSHGFFTGQAVLMESDSTAPTIANYEPLQRYFLYVPNANEVELVASFPSQQQLIDAGQDFAVWMAANSGTPTGGGSGNHRLRPFKASFVFATAIDAATDTITTNVPHGFVDGAFVEYTYFGTSAAAIGGLYKYDGFDGAINRLGAYEIVTVVGEPTKFKLKEIEGANKGSVVNLTGSFPAGTQMFHLAIKTMAAETSPSLFDVENNTVVNTEPTGRSKVAVPTNLETNALGSLPTVSGSLAFSTSDPVKRALAKIFQRLEILDPPAWYADRFYHFKAADLVGVIADGASVEILPNGISGGTFEFEQATAGLRGTFHLQDENGLPYVKVSNTQGYFGNENFPDLTAGFSFAVKGRAMSELDNGYFMSTLNNNANAGNTPLDATWNFSFTYAGVLRWYNAGVIADRTRDNNLQLILGTTATASKLFYNGTDVTEDGTKVAKPTRLYIGDPHASRNLGAGSRIYEIVFWDKELDTDEATAFNSDNAV